jgi:monosaccharide-transporting ATPase
MGGVKKMSEQNLVCTMKGICKTYPGVNALSDVDFELCKGEIHSIVGENGAGKSTLIKVLTGAEQLDSGEIKLDGISILAKSPQDAQNLGISTVYQEVNLCSNLSVAENLFIGREPMKHRKIDWKVIYKKSEVALSRLNIKLDVRRSLDEYSIATQQMVAIARALDIQAKVLILDEPTSSLDKNEVEELFKVMRKVRSEGISIIFITHFLEQIYNISDRITILRNGKTVGVYEAASLSRLDLVSKMMGRQFTGMDDTIKNVSNNVKVSSEEPFYKATNVGHSGTIHPFDLEIRKGEVIGFAGLLGSGRTETARVIFGIDKQDSGEVYINGKSVNIHSAVDAIEHGIGFCSENRKVEGIVANLSIRENIILALQAKKGLWKFLTKSEQDRISNKYVELLNIKTSGLDQLAGTLSGGNQQKIILARWLATNPDFLILDEPTRGIDVGAKFEIQKNVVEFAKNGMAIVFISSELEEVFRTSNRVVVFRDLNKIAELNGDEISVPHIMQTIAGGFEDVKN